MKNRTGVNAGFTILVIFIILLTLLGYAIELSLLMGIIAGWAGSLLVSWQQIKAEDIKPAPPRERRRRQILIERAKDQISRLRRRKPEEPSPRRRKTRTFRTRQSKPFRTRKSDR